MNKRNPKPMVKERTRKLSNIEKESIKSGKSIKNDLGHVKIVDDTITTPILDKLLKNHKDLMLAHAQNRVNKQTLRSKNKSSRHAQKLIRKNAAYLKSIEVKKAA